MKNNYTLKKKKGVKLNRKKLLIDVSETCLKMHE